MQSHISAINLGVTSIHAVAVCTLTDRHTSLFFKRKQTAKIGFYKTDPVSVDPVLKRGK